ncbi:hypothetical protein E1B28_007397 [Marasmius oreades]|uniref:FCP1 homology domain-containing protein n=1 Tax=Marasmius oreades TaxID=181124 RepID=A0A9P7S1J7_9AGAR|nr:uncharacterized protein E1B28_007397 [Marasmius oreades]KAG7093746.1 hypothetical protein E1B28_007397 [Marasmius oreades]
MSEDPYHDAYSDGPYTNITPAIKAIELDPYSDEYTHTPEGLEDITYYPAPSPAPRTPTIPNSPSEDYLKLSQTQSTKLEDPMKSRKLLILDLNGTLLFRAPHARNRDNKTDDVYAQFPPGPRPLRAVNPRPYMSSFREYVFHPSTRRWLDTMVWSSAQPHNVKDMVERCFGEDSVEEEDVSGRGRSRGRNRGRGGGSGVSPGIEVDEFGREKRGKLVAVWARDRMGLDTENYFKKTQTTKDLTKPWNHWRHHSAESTLLLDDSPLKAKLQPYNHLCVPEYTQTLRNWDLGLEPDVLRIAGREDDKVQGTDAAEARELPMSNPLPITETTGTVSNEETIEKGSLKRKRFDSQPFDHILLAVIGILDALKHQSNVSSWIRDGGIWADDPKGSEGEEDGVDEDDGGLNLLYLATSPDLGGESVVDPNMRERLGPKARWRTNKNSKRRKIAEDAGDGVDEAKSTVDKKPCRKGKSERAAEREEKGIDESPEVLDGNESDASGTTSKNDEETAGTSNSNSTTTLTDAGSGDSVAPLSLASTSSLKKPSTLTYTESIGTFEPITTFIDTHTNTTGSGSSSSANDASQSSEDSLNIPGLTLPFGRSPQDAIPVENDTTLSLPTLSPMMWYQDKESRKYWVNRGQKALQELGIECIPGVVRS